MYIRILIANIKLISEATTIKLAHGIKYGIHINFIKIDHKTGVG